MLVLRTSIVLRGEDLPLFASENVLDEGETAVAILKSASLIIMRWKMIEFGD